MWKRKPDFNMKKASLRKMFQKQLLSDQLITAVKENDVPQLEALRKAGKSLTACDKNGNTLLHLAIQHQVDGSTLDVFEYLLKLPYMRKTTYNNYNRTPVMEAFGCKKNGEDYALLLIKAGCDVHKTLPDDDTLLHLAVYNRWFEVAELLIEKGVDVDSQNSSGETPLHIAGKLGCVDIAWMLLFFGADPNCTFTSWGDFLEQPITTSTFFDVIAKERVNEEMREVFFGEACKYDKYFSLLTFVDALESTSNTFYKLIECAYDLNYTYDELKMFSKRIHLFKWDRFKLFNGKFGYIIEEMYHECCLDELFSCGRTYFVKNYSENFFTLIGSDTVGTLVEQVNFSPLSLIVHLVKSFTIYRNNLELLTKILCAILSYGAVLTADAVNEIYFSFGYCELFKIVLHMEICGLDRSRAKITVPRIIYDMSLDLNIMYHMYSENLSDNTVRSKISKYFTVPSSVPTLLELARNAARQYVITKLKGTNSMRFYTTLRSLPIPELHKKMISFEEQLF